MIHNKPLKYTKQICGLTPKFWYLVIKNQRFEAADQPNPFGMIDERNLDEIVAFRYSRNPTMKPDPNVTSPLSAAVLHILLALAGEDLHGYGIIQEVAQHSEGRYKLGPGTLYDNLKKLMDANLVVDAPKSASAKDDDRRFYRLTANGRQALSAEVDRLQTIVREARSRLQETRPRRA